MIASLMMYNFPQLSGAHARYWQAIRQELTARGIDSPASLSQEADVFSVWRAPGLVLSQTCGMPYRTQLHDHVTYVGTPDFGLKDCAPGYYRSAFVVRRDDPRTKLGDFRDARFAYNQTISQSGWAAPHAHLRPQGWWFRDLYQSHGHVLSAHAVAEGHADIASLDAQTWVLIGHHDPVAAQLRVLEWTAPTPGLPYIAGPNADAQATADAVSAAITRLSVADAAALCLRGLVQIPAATYLAVPNPPQSDRPDID